MRRLKSNARLIFLSLLCGLVYFVIHYREQFIGLEHFDEGINLFGAVNLLEGKLPYKDFYSLYPPGYHLFIAAIFKLFGATVVNVRLAILILHSLAVSLAFILSTLIGSLLFGVITAFTLLVFHTDIQRGMIPLIITAYIFMHLFFKTQKGKYLFLSGFLLGMSSFFRIDFAFYSLLASGIVLALYTINILAFPKLSASKSKPLSITSHLRKIIPPYIVGLAIGIVPLLIFVWEAGWWNSWWYLVVLTREIAINRALPCPAFPNPLGYIRLLGTDLFPNYLKQVMTSWLFYFPYLVCLLTLVDLTLRRNSLLKVAPHKFYSRILVTLSIVLFSPYMLGRSDIEHTWPIYFFVFTLFPSALEGIYFTISKYKLLRIIVLILLFFCILIFANRSYLGLLGRYLLLFSAIAIIYYLSQKSKIKIRLTLSLFIAVFFFFINLLFLDYLRVYRSIENYPKDLIIFDVPRTGGIFVSQRLEGDYVRLVKYILTTKTKDDFLFSGSTKHDKIFINDVLLYFLTESENATKYWVFEPGIQTVAAVQEEMIQELNNRMPNYVVLWTLASAYNEPNLSSKSSGVFLLDNYIKEKYQVKKQFGYYFVLERKED